MIGRYEASSLALARLLKTETLGFRILPFLNGRNILARTPAEKRTGAD